MISIEVKEKPADSIINLSFCKGVEYEYIIHPSTNTFFIKKEDVVEATGFTGILPSQNLLGIALEDSLDNSEMIFMKMKETVSHSRTINKGNTIKYFSIIELNGTDVISVANYIEVPL